MIINYGRQILRRMINKYLRCYLYFTDGSLYNFKLYDVLGKSLLNITKVVDGTVTEFDTKKLPVGIYFLLGEFKWGTKDPLFRNIRMKIVKANN